MLNKRFRRVDGAFTMIELMVVLIIVSILAAAILPNVIGKSDKAKRTKAQADIAMIEGFLDEFYLDMDRYPTTDEGLRILYFQPDEDTENWGGPYSKKPIPKDPWKNPYIYECPGTHSSMPYEVYSLGKDGEEGGEDFDADIISWFDEEEE